VSDRIFECVGCGATFNERRLGEATLDRFVDHVETDHAEDLEILEGDYVYFLDQHSEERLTPAEAERLGHESSG
jgi:hypothetical protein